MAVASARVRINKASGIGFADGDILPLADKGLGNEGKGSVINLLNWDAVFYGDLPSIIDYMLVFRRVNLVNGIRPGMSLESWEDPYGDGILDQVTKTAANDDISRAPYYLSVYRDSGDPLMKLLTACVMPVVGVATYPTTGVAQTIAGNVRDLLDNTRTTGKITSALLSQKDMFVRITGKQPKAKKVNLWFKHSVKLKHVAAALRAVLSSNPGLTNSYRVHRHRPDALELALPE